MTDGIYTGKMWRFGGRFSVKVATYYYCVGRTAANWIVFMFLLFVVPLAFALFFVPRFGANPLMV
jgi:hypothetical protein